jgi:hypothetical protein
MGQSFELRHTRVEAVTFDESARARDANPDSGGSARATERTKPTDTQPSRRSDAASARFARRSGSRPAVTDVAWDAHSATRAVRRARDPPRGERGRSADADDRGRLKRGKTTTEADGRIVRSRREGHGRTCRSSTAIMRLFIVGDAMPSRRRSIVAA